MARGWLHAVVILVLVTSTASSGMGQSSADSMRTRVGGSPGDSPGIVAGLLIDADGRPIPYGTVVLVNTDQESFADAQGFFRFSHVDPGIYSVRGRQIGYSPKDTTINLAPGSGVTGVTLRLAPIPLPLPRVLVKPGVCTSPGPPDSIVDPALAGIFTQLRENVNRLRILLDRYPFHFRREDSLAIRSAPGDDITESIDTTRFESRGLERYHVGRVVYTETDFRGRRMQYMYLPELRDLGDSTFLATHCWSWGGVGRLPGGSTDAMLIIDFIPSAKMNEPDVAGSIYLDSARLIARRAIVRLTNPGAADTPLLGFTAITTFREIVPFVPVTDSLTSYEALESRPEGVTDTSRARLVDRGRLLDYKFEQRTPPDIRSNRPAWRMAMATAPAMPGQAAGFELVRGPVADSLAGSLDYLYAQGDDSVEVSLTPYDSATKLRARDDTLDYLFTEYSVASDTLTLLAERNGLKINFYFHREDDLHLNGHKYRGYVMRWTWKSQDGHRSGCDASFVTPAAIRLGWSCYQQTYALPEGLLRVRAQLDKQEGTANGELRGLSTDLVAAIVSPGR
jgi:hypothetical protein